MKIVKKSNYREGFTLIELVLVIAIIGILATMVIPRFIGVTKEAEKKADLASARTIASAVTIAINEADSLDEIGKDDIEKYLSNIEVMIGNTSSDGWSVVFDNDKSGDFTIYKNGYEMFPEPKEGTSEDSK